MSKIGVQAVSQFRDVSTLQPAAGLRRKNIKNIEDTLLYHKVKPLFIIMKITGIFFSRRKIPLNLHHRLRKLTTCSIEQVWCTTVCIALTVNFIRSLTSFMDITNSDIFFTVTMVIFIYEAMSRAYLAYVVNIKEKHGLESLFNNIEMVCYPDKIIPYEDSLVKTNAVFIVMTFVLSLGNLASLIYGIYFASPQVVKMFDVYFTPLSPSTTSETLGLEILIIIFSFLNVQVAILSLAFFIVVCYILYKEFEYNHRIFKMKLKDDGVFTEDLEKFRLNHQKRCKLVEEANRLFKLYIANTYASTIPLLCLLLYSVLYNDTADESFRIISVYRLIYVSIQFVMLSVAAILINDQAHAPLEDIHSIKVYETTPERSLTMNMFLNKLTGSSIGLTAWDIFVINKPTMLTIVGMITTYFFLLIQFKQPINGLACNCSCVFDMSNYS